MRNREVFHAENDNNIYTHPGHHATRNSGVFWDRCQLVVTPPVTAETVSTQETSVLFSTGRSVDKRQHSAIDQRDNDTAVAVDRDAPFRGVFRQHVRPQQLAVFRVERRQHRL